MSQQLSNEVLLTKVANYTSAGTSEIEGTRVDMQGYLGVCFITTVATANAGNYIKAQQDTATAMGTAADLLGSKTVATGANELLFCDVYRPTERYVRPVVVRGASTAVGEIYALQYGASIEPADNSVTDTVAGKQLISPTEGTA